MIPELERYQGVVLRQLVIACPEGVRLQSVNEAGRADAFAVGGAAFLVKHSGKRMSPWRFTWKYSFANCCGVIDSALMGRVPLGAGNLLR